MHHWENAHHGHAEHCCFCIPTNIGANIIGVFVVLGAIYGGLTFAGSITTGSLLAIGLTGFFFLLVGFVAFRYLQMVMHNEEHTRKHFASAYKILAHLATFFLILGFIVTAFFAVIGIFGGVIG